MRIERDFLGEKEVPTDVYYGVQTLRAVENFPITGYPVPKALITAFGHVKKAAALANADIGQLERQKAEAIGRAADELIAGRLHEQIIVDAIQGGAGTSTNMNVNEVLANRALELLGHEKGEYTYISPNTHVNMSQSTNDTYPTSMHVAILSEMPKLLDALRGLHATFLTKAAQFQPMIKMGRTHLQDAVPIRLGQEFRAYAKVVERNMTRLEQSLSDLYEVNLGATAVGTGLNAERRYIDRAVEHLAASTALPIRSAEDLVDATQNTETYVYISGTLKATMLSLSKIANDLRLMSSGPRAGLNEITLPPRQPGSSIMPGKVNPVMAEVVNQVAFQVAGNDQTIAMASEAGQFELNVMEPVLIFNLLQSIETMTNVIRVFDEYCVIGIEANEDVMHEYVSRSIGIITAINPHVGYERASQIAKEALETGRPIRTLCREHRVLTEEQLDLILDPEEMTEPGIAGEALLSVTTRNENDQKE